MADTSSGRLVSFLVEGDDMITCEVCMEPFHPVRTTPKLLPCGHNFCEKCLFSLCCHQQYYLLDSIKCPTCRAPFSTEIARNAPTNYDLCKILENVQRGMELANVTVIHVAAPSKEMSPPLKQLATKSCALRHKKCSDCRRKLPSKSLSKTARFCEKCNTLDTMRFTCLECCVERHNGHNMVTIQQLEANQLKAISELRDVRRRLIEASESFDDRLATIGHQGHAAAVAEQKRMITSEVLASNESAQRKMESTRLLSTASLGTLRNQQVHNLSRLFKLSSILEKTVVVERKNQMLSCSLNNTSFDVRQSRLTLRSDDSLAREALSNLLAILPCDSRTEEIAMIVRGISPKDTVEDRKLIYFDAAKLVTDILSDRTLPTDLPMFADALLNCFYQLNVLSRKKNEPGVASRKNIWKLVQFAYSVVMRIVSKTYPAFHPERVDILDDLAFLCHLYSDVCDQATVALLLIEATRARAAENNLTEEDRKRTTERLQMIDDHLLELRRLQKLQDLRTVTRTRRPGIAKTFWRRFFGRR